MAEIIPDPVGPVEPTTPVEPVIPGKVGEEAPITEVDKTNEDDEWANALKETYPTLEKDEEDELAKSEKDIEKTSDDKKTEEVTKSTDEPAKPAEVKETPVDIATREARATQRASTEQVELIKADVQERLYPNLPTELKDSDGDPIRSVEDVMKLLNEDTKEAFTEEEAKVWLLQAQQQFSKNLSQAQKEIDEVANVNIFLKDEADTITSKYGELLKSDESLRDRLWVQYEKTLSKDPTSGVITRAPVSLVEFYDIALAPYAEIATAKQTAVELQAKQEAAQRQADELKKKQTHSDRSDIFGGGQVDTEDSEEKEWGQAFKEYYGAK